MNLVVGWLITEEIKQENISKLSLLLTLWFRKATFLSYFPSDLILLIVKFYHGIIPFDLYIGFKYNPNLHTYTLQDLPRDYLNRQLVGKAMTSIPVLTKSDTDNVKFDCVMYVN